MITLKLNLTQLKHARMKTPKGAEVIVIPITDNSLFVGEKGIYLDIVGFEIKNPEAGKDTHLLKQSFSKENLAAMPEDVKKSLPILGNARITTGGGHFEPEPKDMNNGQVAEGLNDLPF
jgi:hypothetical protein